MHLFESVSVLTIAGLAAAATSGLPSGYNLTGPIQGCSEVDCPYNGSFSLHHTAWMQYTNVGVTNMSSTLGDTPFNWIAAGSKSDSPDDFSYKQAYYLGVPPAGSNKIDFLDNKSGLSACSLIFLMEDIAFPGQDPQRSTGDCGDALGYNCVNAIYQQAVDRLKTFTSNKTLGIREACDQLQQDFKQNFASDCIANGRTKWKNPFQAPLTDPMGLPPVPSNETTAHPTSPHTNSLWGPIWSLSRAAENSTLQFSNYYSLTPILTLFWGNASVESNVKADVQLNCVKFTGYTKEELDQMGKNGQTGGGAGNKTMVAGNGSSVGNGTEGEGGDSGVGRSEVPGLTVFALLVVACLHFML